MPIQQKVILQPCGLRCAKNLHRSEFRLKPCVVSSDYQRSLHQQATVVPQTTTESATLHAMPQILSAALGQGMGHLTLGYQSGSVLKTKSMAHIGILGVQSGERHTHINMYTYLYILVLSGLYRVMGCAVATMLAFGAYEAGPLLSTRATAASP